MKKKTIISFSNNEYQAINRNNFYQKGLPEHDSYHAKGKIFYNSSERTWNCMICNQKMNKFSWKKMTMHVNSKHNASQKKRNPKRKLKSKTTKRYKEKPILAE